MLVRIWRENTLNHGWWECKLAQQLWEEVMRVLRNLEINLQYEPVIALLSIYSKKMKSTYKRVICTPMFIEAQFTIAKLWNQSRHESADE